MRKNTNKEIDFNDAVITPLNQRVEIKMDLDDDIIDYLRYLSAKSNQSLDNIINHVLGDLCSKHLELKDVSAEEIKAFVRDNASRKVQEAIWQFYDLE